MRAIYWAGCVAVMGVCFGAGAVPATEPFAAAGKASETFEVGTLHVERFGVGKRAVVLIPGLACGTWEWGGTIEKLKGEYTIYAVTLPGFDGRAATEKGPLFEVFAGDFWEMLRVRGIEKPVVVGHSLGGTLAILLAEGHSERLGGIVAVDGLPVFPTLADATVERRKWTAAGLGRMYTGLSPGEELEQEREYMKTVGTNRAEVVEWAAAREARSDAKAVGAWLKEDLENDLRGDLKKVGVPMLEIVPYEAGNAMGYTLGQTEGFYRSILAGAPGVKVAVISGSRHFVMLDQAEGFYKEVGAFLKGVKEGN